ncbi:MAG: sugar phosphate isomerase/epimerase [Fimbriimonadaceae bacterium]|nr:sugar phosphate isomerase/epimerase [Fimbriimonadaceae bacterium]
MQLSLFTVSYAGFWGQARLSTAECIAKAAELGYDAVMLMGKRPHGSPLDAAAEVPAMQAALAQHGVTCPVVAAYTDFVGGNAGEVPWLELQIGYVEALARCGAKVGAKVVRVFTAYEPAAGGLTAVWDRTVVGLRECADRAAAYGLSLAIQNHHDLGVQTAVLLELLADIDRPNAKLGFDAWSPFLRGEDVYHAAYLAAPHTLITTNADYVRLPRWRYRPDLVNYEPAGAPLVRAVPFGSGDIPYAEFFAGLTDGGFDGVASYEACSPLRGGGNLANVDRCARQYITWMHEHVLPA